MKPKLSLVCIAKDEENIIERMINSVKDICDEMILVDTGSTDNTREIIKKYTTLRELPFIDFGTTKNAACDLATGDYILFMDCDEVLYRGAEVIREWVDGNNFDCLMTKITEGPNDYNIIAQQYDRARVWKNDRTWHFVGAVHETLVKKEGVVSSVTDGRILVRHDHSGKKESQLSGQRFLKYVELLDKDLDKDPNNLRARFYKARTLRDLGRPLEAISEYIVYLSHEENLYKDERYQAAIDTANLYKDLGEFEKAFKYCDICNSIDPRRCEHDNLRGLIYFTKQEFDKAAECYKISAAKPIPDNVILFLNPLEYQLTSKDQLVLSYFNNKEYDKAEEVCQIESQDIQPFDRRILNNLWWSRTKTNMKIFLTLGNTPEPIYGGMIEKEGVHGVETTYIELARTLYERGHDVFLFCTTKEDHIYNGVRYIRREDYNDYLNLFPDVIITSRWFDSLKVPQGKKILWLQDANPLEASYDFKQVDKVIVSSQWHADYLTLLAGHSIPKGKLEVITLGIDSSLFEPRGLERNKFKVLYGSNPDRGLGILADMWPEIVRRIPLIKLAITYGWQGLQTWNQSQEWQDSVEGRRQATLEKFKDYDVNFLGRVTKKQLANEMMTSSVLVYPNDFYETFCLTALEAQAAGMIVITSDAGALNTTVDHDVNVLLQGSPHNRQYQKEFIDNLEGILMNEKKFLVASEHNKNKFKSKQLDWKDVADLWEKLIWRIL